MMKRIFLSLLLIIAMPAWAELSPNTANKIQKAAKLQEESKLGEAIKLLAAIETSRKYDRAFVDRTLGVFYWQYGNSKKAIQFITRAVDSGQLKDEQAWTTQRMLADLLLMEGNYAKALQYYYPLTKSIPADQSAEDLWLRITQAHYQRQHWKKVLEASRQYERVQKRPNVPALSLKLGAQLQLEHWKGSIPTLKTLIRLEPKKKSWWQQLSSNYLRINSPRDALSVFVLAERKGITLTTDEKRTVAQLYAQQGVPEKAARILKDFPAKERDIRVIAAEASYWQQAREWNEAISTWKVAAKYDNKYQWELALLQLQQGQYRDALSTLDKVKSRKRRKDVELARVRAYYKLSNLDKAMLHAKRAESIAPSNEAKSWLRYLEKRQQMQG